MTDKLKRLFARGVFFTGWKNALACLALAVAVYFTDEIYFLLNHGPAVLNLRTPLDDAIPVVPVFVIPYVSLNPYVYATLIILLLLRTRIFQSTALAMLGAWLVSYLFYYFLQSEMIRPVLTGTDVFTQMIRAVYAGDNPYNCFPSLHTSISTIMAVAWYRFDRRAGIAAGVWTALIVASTVLIKQHYLADVLGGLIVAFAAAWVAGKLVPQRAKDA
jgi:membrane-associated phospholipid phosphatase